MTTPETTPDEAAALAEWEAAWDAIKAVRNDPLAYRAAAKAESEAFARLLAARKAR
ncbi:MAG: hypothetical protein WC985_06180 [Thermoplasmata archaeon]